METKGNYKNWFLHSLILTKHPVLSSDRTILNLTCYNKEQEIKIKPDYTIAAIGREPNLDFLSKDLAPDQSNLIGDVKNGLYRQVSISVADGIRIAMEINNLSLPSLE